jgi:hypothetical protein
MFSMVQMSLVAFAARPLKRRMRVLRQLSQLSRCFWATELSIHEALTEYPLDYCFMLLLHLYGCGCNAEKEKRRSVDDTSLL